MGTRGLAEPRQAGAWSGSAGLWQQRTAFGEDRNIEAGRKPLDDSAQFFQRRSRAASFGAQPREVAGGVQFEQARPLLARPCDCPLKAMPGLFVMTFALPDAAAQPDDFRAVILFLGRLGEALGFGEAGPGLVEAIGP